MFSHKIGGIGWNFVNLTADSVTAVDWQTGRLKTGSQVISQTACCWKCDNCDIDTFENAVEKS